MSETAATSAPPGGADVQVEAKLVDKKRLYVSWAVTHESLIAVAKAAAPDAKVTDARALSGPARAFGFVTFATEEEAAAALAAMNGKTITTEPIQVDFAKKSTGEKKPRTPRRGGPKKKKEGGKASPKKKGPKKERESKEASGDANGNGASATSPAKKGPKKERKPKKEDAASPAAATTPAATEAASPSKTAASPAKSAPKQAAAKKENAKKGAKKEAAKAST